MELRRLLICRVRKVSTRVSSYLSDLKLTGCARRYLMKILAYMGFRQRRPCIDVQRTPIYVCRVSHVTVSLDGAHRKTVFRSLLTYVKLRLQAILTNVIYTMGTFFWLICLAVSLLWPCGVSPRPDVRHRVDCFIQMINLWTSNYLQRQYSIFVDPKLM